MSAQIRSHLNELKSLVLSHPRVHGVSIRREEVTVARGYLRVRLLLQSQDVVEVFVYLVERGGVVHLQDYSLHWQHSDGVLVQRWDTAPHHPELANFPSHIHRATGEVEPTATLAWNGFPHASAKRNFRERCGRPFNRENVVKQPKGLIEALLDVTAAEADRCDAAMDLAATTSPKLKMRSSMLHLPGSP